MVRRLIVPILGMQMQMEQTPWPAHPLTQHQFYQPTQRIMLVINPRETQGMVRPPLIIRALCRPLRRQLRLPITFRCVEVEGVTD